jgi:hypothetical protein
VRQDGAETKPADYGDGDLLDARTGDDLHEQRAGERECKKGNGTAQSHCEKRQPQPDKWRQD